MMPAINRIYSAGKFIISSFNSIIAPKRCLACDAVVEDEKRQFEFLCTRCADNLPLAPEPHIIFNRLVSGFKPDELAISNAFSLFSVEDKNYMELIHSFKYAGFTRIGTEFGRELGNIIRKYSANDFDYIIPVPIHHARKRERGFNQSDYIADAISSVLNIPVDKGIIIRPRYTQTQTKLSSEERKINVGKAFTISKKSLNLKDGIFLIVDDVLTTGSTLNSCAQCLLENGAKRVEIATLAIA